MRIRYLAEHVYRCIEFIDVECFVCIFLGGRITTAHDDVDFAILQISWYRFPFELKKIQPIVLSMAHKEIALRGIGSMTSSRESFQRVCSKSI